MPPAQTPPGHPKVLMDLKGFSVIESLVAIAIVFILTAIGFLVFANLQPNLKLNGATRELITDLRYAQQSAISEQIQYGIRFSTTTPEMPDDYKLIKYGQTIEEVFKKQLEKGIKFQKITFSGEEAIFNPYGAAKEPGQIVLINSQNATSTIDVRPSGFVQKK